ncbi:hypothetical protein D7V95_10170 [bacterium J10(2018)]|nr:hypothetical protein D7V95_10170 [bacterium J10(2018)]
MDIEQEVGAPVVRRPQNRTDIRARRLWITIQGEAGRRGTGVPTGIADVLSAGSVPEALHIWI